LPLPEIICLTNGIFEENCFILADRDRGEAVLVDPGEEADLFLARLDTERLALTGIWLTHGHLDHVMGVGRVVERAGVPVWLHPADRPLYDAVPQQAASLLGIEIPPPPAPDYDLADGDAVRVGDAVFDVLHVPGHSPGHVAFVVPGAAVSGDVLFAGSIGRTDLPGGSAETLLRSIRERLAVLPDDTVVYPGHGPATTIGSEKATNPFLLPIASPTRLNISPTE